MRTFALGILVLLACKGGVETPPNFNAVDPSLSCEAGKIGWDFSTGGNTDDVKVLQQSNEIRVVEATVGTKCGASAGNRTESFATSCNGLTTCFRPAFLSTETNPVPDCVERMAHVKYQCGVEETVYEADFPAFGLPDEVRIECGPKLTIISAAIGKNCDATSTGTSVNTDNATTGLVERCNGLRWCNLPDGLKEVLTGRIELNGCRWPTIPSAEVKFTCGNDPTVFTSLTEDRTPIILRCDARPSRTTTVINVRSARFGGLDLTSKYKGACDGRTSCMRPVFVAGQADPSPGQSRDFQLEYDCGAGGPQDAITFTSSTSRNVTVQCALPMTISSVTLGKDCDPTRAAAEEAKTTEQFRLCNGRGRCTRPAYANLPSWLSSCTEAQRSLVFTYTCGASTDVKTQRVAWNAPIDFSCPAMPSPDTSAHGIRMLEASRGLNCEGAPASRVRNNLYPNAWPCTGLDACSMSTALPAGTPECRTPEVQIAYRCGEDETVHTINGLVSALGASVRVSCEPAITVTSATFGANCSAQAGNASTALKQQCDGRLGTCTFAVAQLGLASAPANCTPNFTATYRCGPDPTLKTATLDGNASQQSGTLTCPVPTTPYVRKACVPKQCVGKTRRDENLNCISDLTKSIIPAPSTWSLFSSEDRFTVLQENWPFSLVLSTTFDQALPSSMPFDTEVAQATVYAVDQFAPRNGDPAIEGFRCVVANPGLRRPLTTATIAKVDTASIAAGKVLVGQANNFVVPANCFGANVASWKDALRRSRQQTGSTITEADFRQGYQLVKTELRVAFDPQGKTAALRTVGTTEATATVPNPIGFFYNPPLLWVDFLSFYEQSRLPRRTGGTPAFNDLSWQPEVKFNRSNNIIVSATKATLRKAEAEVDLYDATRLPMLELDLDWLMAGDSPGRNPLSPTQVLSPTISNSAQLNLGATVEIQTKDVFDANVGNSIQQWTDAMTVGAQQGTLLGVGEPTGTTTRVMANMTEALRARLVLVKTANNNGWMSSINEAMRQFKVRVCIDMDTIFRLGGYDFPGIGIGAQRGDEQFGLMIGTDPNHPTFKRCVVADQVLIVRRTMEQKLLPHDHDGADTQVGQSLDQGNPDVNNSTDMGNVGTCTRRCTVTPDCGQGQTCVSGVCTGGTASRCTSETKDSSGGTGVFGASMLRTSTKSTSDDNQSNGGTATTTGTAELLGFQILQQSNTQSWTTPGAHGSFTISPNWDLIIAIARDGLRTATQAAILQPIITGRHWEGGRQGLGIGLGRNFFIFIGPVPIMAEVGVTAGFGLSLQFEFDLASDYPCIGTQTCYVLHSEKKSLSDANAVCQDAGGQLAELSSANALAGARAAITDASVDHWVGGQLATLWPQPSCATVPRDASCVTQSVTKYRWIKSNTPFAEQHATSTTLFNTSTYTSAFGGSNSQLSALTPRVPSLGGVALRKASAASNDSLRSSSETDLKPFVCEFAPASRARASTWSAGIVLSAAAGASFSACVPHSSLGICLSAGINLIDAQMSFAFERSNTRLWDRQGLLMSAEGTDAFKITASIAFLTGAISVEVKLLFFSISYDLVSFEGVKKYEWELYKHEFPTSQH